VAKLVRYCENKSLSLEDLSLEELKSFHPWIEKDVYDILSLENHCLVALILARQDL